LRDEIHLATPPPHPSDVPLPNNNPLATNVLPPSAGVQLSLTAIASKPPPVNGLFRTTTFDSITEEAPRSPASDAGSVFRSDATTASLTPALPAFGDGNPALAVPSGKEGKDGSKRRKPKTNIVKSNSTFVSRVIVHDATQKRLAERSLDGVFAFININRAIHWLDLSAENKVSGVQGKNRACIY